MDNLVFSPKPQTRMTCGEMHAQLSAEVRSREREQLRSAKVEFCNDRFTCPKAVAFTINLKPYIKDHGCCGVVNAYMNPEIANEMASRIMKKFMRGVFGARYRAGSISPKSFVSYEVSAFGNHHLHGFFEIPEKMTLDEARSRLREAARKCRWAFRVSFCVIAKAENNYIKYSSKTGLESICLKALND